MTTILIIEDSPATAAVLQNAFRSAGWQVMSAYNGEAGLRTISDFKVDLVLLDLMMPKVDGLEFLRLLRARPQDHDLPVIVLSYTTSVEQVQEAWKLGAAVALWKANITPKTLVETAQRVITSAASSTKLLPTSPGDATGSSDDALVAPLPQATRGALRDGGFYLLPDGKTVIASIQAWGVSCLYTSHKWMFLKGRGPADYIVTSEGKIETDTGDKTPWRLEDLQDTGGTVVHAPACVATLHEDLFYY